MRTLTVILIALALPFAAGCGGDDGTTTSGGATPPAGTSGGGAGETVSVTARDFSFDPAEVSVAAGTVTFNLANGGSATHALTIDGNGVNETSDAIEPGGTTSLTVDLAPGTYEIFCPIGNHKAMGMVGTVTVT